MIASASSEPGKVKQSISVHLTHPVHDIFFDNSHVRVRLTFGKIDEWSKVTSQTWVQRCTVGTGSLVRLSPSGLCILITIASLLGNIATMLWILGN
jgi:hypothetical protein